MNLWILNESLITTVSEDVALRLTLGTRVLTDQFSTNVIAILDQSWNESQLLTGFYKRTSLELKLAISKKCRH